MNKSVLITLGFTAIIYGIVNSTGATLSLQPQAGVMPQESWQLTIQTENAAHLPLIIPNTLTIGKDQTDWTKIALVVLAAFNLCTVIWIFKTNRNDKIRDRNIDQEKEIDSFWIQKMVLEPNADKLREYFEETSLDIENHIIACRENDPDIIGKAQAAANRFATRIDEVVKRVIDPLDYISPIFSENLGAAVDEIQDAVTEVFDRHNIPSDVLLDNIKKSRKKFWCTLLHSQKALTEIREAKLNK